MEGVIATPAGKKILVFSDNGGLAEAIECTLTEGLKLQVKRHKPGPPTQAENTIEMDDLDLIVLALSSPTSEPVVMLGRASLIDRIGRVPILIISDRSFYPDLDTQVFHLDFPFEPSDLFDKVEAILQRDPELALTNIRPSRRTSASTQRRTRRVG